MGIDEPRIDDRGSGSLLAELLSRIPVNSPEWTDFNESDPGVTLVGLFSFLTESLLWQIDERQRRRRRRRRVALLIAGTVGIGLVLWTSGREWNG